MRFKNTKFSLPENLRYVIQYNGISYMSCRQRLKKITNVLCRIISTGTSCILHGRFGKVAQVYHYIQMVLVDGMNKEISFQSK